MRYVGAYLAAVSGAAMTLLVISLLLGHTSDQAVLPGVFVALLMAAMSWRTQSTSTGSVQTAKPGIIDWMVLALAGVFVVRTGLWLAWEQGANLVVGSPNNLGDFCLHLTHVKYLSETVPFWPVNPISAGDPLSYPIGMALWQLLLVKLGLPILGAFALASMVGLGFGVVAAWRWGRAFGLAALLCNGGIAGWALLGTGVWANYQTDMAWKSIPLSILVTQRGFLYALPAGLWLMMRWRRCLVRKKDTLNWLDVWIYTTLPLFHLHSFIALSTFLLAWLIGGRQRGRVLCYGLASLPVATWLVWLVTGGGSHTGTQGFVWGWFAEPGQSALDALWENFGLWLVILPTLSGWLIWRRLSGQISAKEREGAAWVWPGMALMVIGLTWKLQPWAWDNTKLMLWGWLGIAPFVWTLWLRQLPRRISWLLNVVLFGSGFITLLGGLPTGMKGGYFVANRLEIIGAEQMRRKIPSGAVVAAAPTYNHPLLLAGQPIALGYAGHLWSHGIAYEDRRIHLDHLLNGDDGWQENAKALGADYLFWGQREAETYPNSKLPWLDSAHLVTENAAGVLLDLTKK